MIIKIINGCFGTNTTINGIDIANLSKEELIEVYNKMVNKLECREDIITHINSLVDTFGVYTGYSLCEQCGYFNDIAELEF